MEARGITGEWACSHTEHDAGKFRLHTADSIRAVVDRLAEASSHVGKDKLKELQTNLGFHHAPGSVLFQEHTRSLLCPTTKLRFGWMHILFVSGIFALHVGLLFKAMQKEKRFTYAAFHRYASLWHWPSSVDSKSALDELKPERAKIHLEEIKFKTAASEARTLTPVLAHFVRQTLMKSDDAAEREHAICFLLLADFIEELEASARGLATVERSKDLASAYLLSFKRLS